MENVNVADIKKAKFVCLDIEVFVEMWCVVITDFHSGEEITFEISRRQNQLKEFVRYFNELCSFYKLHVITFNGNNYDNIIINWLLKNYSLIQNKDYVQLTSRLYQINVEITNAKKAFDNPYKKYSYNYPFQSIDLMQFWALLTIKSKKLSLKFFAISLDMSVEECPIKWTKINLTDEEIQIIIDYCKNDVKVTRRLGQFLKAKINFRIDLKHKKGLNCLSWSEVKIGTESLLISIAEKNNIELSEIKKMGTDRTSVKLSEIVANDIVFTTPRTFKHWKEVDRIKDGKQILLQCFDTFTDALVYIKTLEVYDTKSISVRVYFKDVVYDIKSGGLHSFHPNKQIVKRKENDLYEDVDVSSWYPTLGCNKGYIPIQFKKLGLADILRKDKEERVLDKKAGRKLDAEVKKLRLNGGFYGNTNNAYSPMRDWQCTLQITVNGQLYLLKNAEMQTQNEKVIVDMVNTDGITYYFPKTELDYFKKVNKEWEDLTLSELEQVSYEMVARNSVNGYVAFYYDDGKLKTKEKGFYVTQPDITSSKHFLVIPKIIIEYLKQKYFYDNIIDIEETVRKHSNMYDFCSSVKVAKNYTVIFDGKEAQHLNRYYVALNGTYLFKKKDGGNLNAIVKGVKLSLMNKEAEHLNDKRNLYGINYRYYVSEINKIIKELEITIDNKDNLLINTNNQIKMF